VESDGDQWHYAVTCTEFGCGGVIYEGMEPTSSEAEKAALIASGIHTRLCTDKVIARPPIIDRDYERLVYLLGNEGFMEEFGGSLAEEKVAARLVEMRNECIAFAYAEQLVLDRDTGIIVSIVGARRLGPNVDFTWRTDPHPDHRRKGYAEEGSRQLLKLWDKREGGAIFARIGVANEPSRNLATRKLGFVRVDPVTEDTRHRQLYRRGAESA
jgi:RimJ/RimL family protein N-acetyltransferase